MLTVRMGATHGGPPPVSSCIKHTLTMPQIAGAHSSHLCAGHPARHAAVVLPTVLVVCVVAVLNQLPYDHQEACFCAAGE